MTEDVLKVALTTLGCKLNLYETERMRTILEEGGCVSVPFDRKADIYIINTCTVTGRADYKSRQMVRRAIRINPDALVIVAGCYAQLNPEVFHNIEGVDKVLSIDDRVNIGSFLNDVIKKVEVRREVRVKRFYKKTRAFVKVQQGCDQNCAYCRVRVAWGSPGSREADEIIEEIEGLVNNGYKEVVFTGVNVGIYGKDIGTDFLTLLERAERIEGLVRMRLTSIEPHEVKSELIDFVAGSRKMANHFHIPLQSGSDRILERMNRRYSSDEFKQIIIEIIEKIPYCGIGADVMVGFPGETGEDYERTYELIEELPFTYLHVFTYSPRPDTLAFEFEDTVNPEVKNERSEQMRELRYEKMVEFRECLVGREETVLVERELNGYLTGLTGNYIPVKLNVEKEGETYTNQFVRVEITEVDGVEVYGEIINLLE